MNKKAKYAILCLLNLIIGFALAAIGYYLSIFVFNLINSDEQIGMVFLPAFLIIICTDLFYLFQLVLIPKTKKWYYLFWLIGWLFVVIYVILFPFVPR